MLDHVGEHGIGNKIEKASNTNRFEYGNLLLTLVGSLNSKRKRMPMASFRHVLEVDVEQKVVTAEGSCTMKTLADALVPKGFMLPIHPEMHEITVGGAIVGIGIESAGHRHGFFHDNVLDADVLCADGIVRTASASNEHADLFKALPNSFGTLGYILKARIRLAPATPYVHMQNRIYTSLADLHRDLGAAAEAKEVDFVEALVFNQTFAVLSQTRLLHSEPPVVHDIYHEMYDWLVRSEANVYLPMQDYMFRFEPDLFCNWAPEPWFNFLRTAIAPVYRNSMVYRAVGFPIESKIDTVKAALFGKEEPLIQDWQVPWASGVDFLNEVLSNVKIPEGKPWLILAIKPNSTGLTNYPLQDTLYLNLGVYLKTVGMDNFQGGGYGRTRFIDSLAFKYTGTKMLYSTSFATRDEYMERYNGKSYEQIKAKYDPNGAFLTLFEKCFNNAH